MSDPPFGLHSFSSAREADDFVDSIGSKHCVLRSDYIDRDYIAVLPWPTEPGPLHARAGAAIERLDLDGSRLELAVAIFGWGSDEANGSLLGLVEKAWPGYGDITLTLVHGCSKPVIEILPGHDADWNAWEEWNTDDVARALVAALEARQP
jgi:hypothetical protein